MDTTKDEDATSQHVIDYYKKYSQNRDLPKYFSGTSVSYLPAIKPSVSPEPEIRTSIKTDISIIVTSAEANDNVDVEEPVASSRASSPMSTHKLEWDSGADIGYGNCQEKRLRKSLSLPTMADLIQKRSENDFGPVTSNTPFTRSQSSNSDGNVKVVLLSESSSSEYRSDGKKYESSSSSSNMDNGKALINSSSSSSNKIAVAPSNTHISISSSDSSKKQSLKQFASTLSYLKQKIGMPGAHSTPKLPDEQQSISSKAHSDTPILKNSASTQVNLKNKKLTRQSCNLAIEPTAASDEEAVQKKRDITSTDLKPTKYPNQKIVNLAVTSPITVECICSAQSLTSRSLQTVTKQSTVAVQTDEIPETELYEIIQTSEIYNNQSLIYFEYSESDKNTGRSTQTNSDIVESNCDSFEYVVKQPSQSKEEELRKSASKPPEQEQATDLKRSQRMHDLRTNRSEENSSSKEWCLGNLVSEGLLGDDISKSIYVLQRLLKSKKYDAVTKKRYVKKIIKRITESKYLEESSTSSELFVPKKLPKTDSAGDKNENKLLQSNVPWYPSGDHPKLSPRKRKLVQKTFTQDFVPGPHTSQEEVSSAPEIVPVHSRDMRKNRFTLTNNEFSVNHRYESVKPLSETESTSLEKNYESSSTSKSYQNWKEDKTLSEKMFEKQSGDKSQSSNGNGDCFVKIADKERQFQIGWINNEISHLGKLKGLLEKPKPTHKKPLNIKRTTTNVYTVFNNNDTPSKPKRNYVIETYLGTRSSSERNFNLDGQIYTVQDYLNSKKKRPRQVTGNIEVVSSDSVTNIKVTTFCEDCGRSPCICNLEEKEGCACMGVCGSQSCTCLGEPSASGRPAKETVSFPLYEEEPKTKMTNSSDDIVGTFLPMVSSVPTVGKFATFPSTSKEDITKGRDFTSSSQEMDISDQATSADFKSFHSQKDDASSYGSLKKVFENCACTQTSCTCDFVEKLVNRFSKPDIPCPTVCDYKCMQTDNNETQSVGLQIGFDTHNQNQQTKISTVDDKKPQTEHMDKNGIKAVGIQTKVSMQSETQQTSADLVDAQTNLTKLEDNFQNIGIQTKTDVRDQILQTSRSLERQNGSRNSVATYISVNEETQTKLVSFVDETTSPVTHSVSTSPDHVAKQMDAGISPMVHSTSTSLHNVRKQQDATTSPMVSSVGTSSHPTTTQKDAAVSPKRRHINTLVDQAVMTAPLVQTTGTSFDQITKTKQIDASVSSKSRRITPTVDETQMTSSLIHSVGTTTDQITEQKEATISRRSVSTLVEQIVVASQTSAAKSSARSQSDSSRPNSSKSSSSTSDRQRNNVLHVCCCTQTEPKSRGKSRRNVKVQMESTGTHSDKENSKRRGESLTTSSVTYEICPSILVSSCNDTSRSISDESSSKALVCVCCSETFPADKISILGSKAESYPLCCNCLAKRPILTSLCYAGPEDNCPCSKPSSYKSTKTNSDDTVKKTGTDSNEPEEYCTCTKPFQYRNSKYCSHCQFKLRNTAKSKNGIAYTLTVESECPNKIRRRKKKLPLEEIKLKVPSPSKRKKNKDKENVSKRDREGNSREDKERKCECGKVVCTSNCHVHGVASKHRRDKNSLTLQEYLQKNRPDFIHSAESRRHVVINSKSHRVIGQVDAKLKFAEENMEQHTTKKPRKLFTEQEMKEITKRNYKKLPEVREKVKSKNEEKLRNADRFIVDVFARKIQRSVLKGKSTFPIDSNVICLPKTCNC